MIKRAGVEIMNARTNNVSIAKQTLAICKKKKYTAPSDQEVDLAAALDASLKETILYSPGPININNPLVTKPTIEVNNETTSQAAARLLANGHKDIVALNFASGINQGGGFLAGAIAQEEDLCRCSGLYPTLKSKPEFYNQNILNDSYLYTDNIIYSPNVPFFRDDHNVLLEESFPLSIISAPAPNLRGADDIDHVMLAITIFNRAERVLRVAARHEHKTIILGAWGCGAYGNDSELIADIFKEALVNTPYFEHVCFAVYDTRQPPEVFETFKKAF